MKKMVETMVLAFVLLAMMHGNVGENIVENEMVENIEDVDLLMDFEADIGQDLAFPPWLHARYGKDSQLEEDFDDDGSADEDQDFSDDEDQDFSGDENQGILDDGSGEDYDDEEFSGDQMDLISAIEYANM